MYFLGREKEIRQIIEAIERGKNITVSGKYGMGRTSLIKHIAEGMQNRWRFVFVDFSKTPRAICNHLLVELFREREFNRENLSYKSSRFRIVTVDLDDKRTHIPVLDNIAKITAPKLDLIRYLAWKKRFQFVAIVESFISGGDLLRLRVLLSPAFMITLRNLSIRSAGHFFQHLSKEHQFHWTEGQVNSLAAVTGGYPPRMKEIAVRKLVRKELNED